MHACETIGAVNVIFSDKTGTLTQNSMTVVDKDVSSENVVMLDVIGALNSTADWTNGDKVTIHDTVEDIPDFDKNLILQADPEEGQAVLDLVLEVTRRENEDKRQFLLRILNTGSQKAKVLKCADRISNMISLGYVTDPKFIERYCDETEFFLLPMSIEVDFNMYQELINLILTRRRYLEDGGYFDNRCKESSQHS